MYIEQYMRPESSSRSSLSSYNDSRQQFTNSISSSCHYSKNKYSKEQTHEQTSDISLIEKILTPKDQYVKKNTISQNSFEWIVNEPSFFCGASIINHLCELFSIENDPLLEKFSIEYLYEQLEIFKQGVDTRKYDLKFGKSMFVVLKIPLMIFYRFIDEDDDEYIQELKKFMNDVWDVALNNDSLLKRLDVSGDFNIINFQKFSSKYFLYIWDRDIPLTNDFS